MLDSYFVDPVWQNTFFSNTLQEYVLFFGIFFITLLLFHLLQKGLVKHLQKLAKKTKTDIDDAIIRIVDSLRPPFYLFLAFYIAFQSLHFSGFVVSLVDAVLIIWVTYQVIVAVGILVDYVMTHRLSSEEDAGAKTAMQSITTLIKGIIWVLGILLILSNLGVDITSLIAGLGIGGIAIAFALQNILGDLFSSFAIFFDKPFQVGDFILSGEHMGSVEKIGIKSTRIRSPQGEEIVISNKELTSARIQNFKKMEKRRIVFSVGVTYETPGEKLRRIPNIIRTIIDGVKHAEVSRVHFKSFEDSALLYEIVYHVASSDYTQFRDVQQEMNFQILEAFQKEGISMAYPTQTVYISKEGAKNGG